MSLTVAITQPGYLPWLGYFDQMARADVFVHFDDVQFTRKSWRARNRIKGPDGPEWLSVPVVHYGEYRPINQVEIGIGDWPARHAGILRDRYRDAPFLLPYLIDFEAVLAAPWRKLVDLDVAVARLLADWLGIRANECFASDLNIPLDLDTTARPLQICQRLGATRFIVGPTAKAYINEAAFQEAGIALEWHAYKTPDYPQLHGGEFVPYLSALDAVFNLGGHAAALISRRPT